MTTPVEITADASAAQAKKNAGYFRKLLQGMPMGGGDRGSMREADYNGHHITIKTTYQIKIDGKPFMGAVDVTNAGAVHYHGIPAAGFASAIDLVKSVIDTFPDEFAAGSGGGMGGMTMKNMGGRGKKTAAKRKTAARK
jgi:hypothetical protein